MNIRRRITLNRWKRRAAEWTPLVLGIAIGVMAFAIFDQSYGEEMAVAQPARITAGPAPIYRTCEEARAAAAAPIYRGQPGYAARLDADRDGVACEPYPR